MMKTIYQLQQMAARLRQVTEVNSISPEDTFGLLADVLEYLADMEQSADGLGIRKVYASYVEMDEDSTSPIGSNGKSLRHGQLVTIFDPEDSSQPETGNVYAWQKGDVGTKWELMGNLSRIVIPDGSVTTEKIADTAVTAEKMAPIELVLCEEAGKLSGSGAEESWEPTGQLGEATHARTRLLRLSAGTYSVTASNVLSGWLYKYSGKTFVSRAELTPGSALQITVPERGFMPIGGESFDGIRVYVTYSGSVISGMEHRIVLGGNRDLLLQAMEYDSGSHEKRIGVLDELTAALPYGNLVRPMHELLMAADTRPDNDAWRLRWNASTGYYEMNGLTDLTYEEVLGIYGMRPLVCGYGMFWGWNGRTIYPPAHYGQAGQCFRNCGIVTLPGATGYGDMNGYDMRFYFFQCGSLRDISRIGINSPAALDGAFLGCQSLETFTINYLNRDVSFEDSPSLSRVSLQNMVDNATNGGPITVTVHSTVYAKINGTGTYDDSQDEAMWIDLYYSARDKNISFATV